MMDTASQRSSLVEDADSSVNWEIVYRQSLPKVYRYFSCWVGEEWLAEDLTSTTFERAWSSRRKFSPGRGPVFNWLMGIARNVKAGHFRNDRQVESLDEASDLRTNLAVEDTAQLNSDFDQMYQMLVRLEKRERELIALKYGAELTNRDIAKITDLSETNVGTILHRVVKRLRSEWEDKQ